MNTNAARPDNTVLEQHGRIFAGSGSDRYDAYCRECGKAFGETTFGTAYLGLGRHAYDEHLAPEAKVQK